MRCVLGLAAFLSLVFCVSSHAALPDGMDKPKVNEEALDKLGWKIGCQAYTFRALSLFALHNARAAAKAVAPPE